MILKALIEFEDFTLTTVSFLTQSCDAEHHQAAL